MASHPPRENIKTHERKFTSLKKREVLFVGSIFCLGNRKVGTIFPRSILKRPLLFSLSGPEIPAQLSDSNHGYA